VNIRKVARLRYGIGRILTLGGGRREKKIEKTNRCENGFCVGTNGQSSWEWENLGKLEGVGRSDTRVGGLKFAVVKVE
jgi:hypothetical protein